MPRKESEAVPKGNGPASQQEEFGSDQPTLAAVYRKIEEVWGRKMDVLTTEFSERVTQQGYGTRLLRRAVNWRAAVDTLDEPATGSDYLRTT